MARVAVRRRLTNQEQEFCAGVARHGNETKAARDAGYAYPNKAAYKLTQKQMVAAEIARLRALVSLQCDGPVIADAVEIRAKFTWLMRHAESEDTQLKAGIVLAKLTGMGSEFNHPGSVSIPALTQAVDATDYDSKSRAELEAEGKVIALRLLGHGDGRG
jgi:hypothetical protein